MCSVYRQRMKYRVTSVFWHKYSPVGLPATGLKAKCIITTIKIFITAKLSKNLKVSAK